MKIIIVFITSLLLAIHLQSQDFPLTILVKDNTVTFTLKIEFAMSPMVVIYGQNAIFGSDTIKLDKVGTAWSKSLTNIPPGFYYYRFIFDGAPMFIRAQYPYFGLGTWTNAFEISDPTNTFAEQKTGPFGNINQSFYKSKILNETRKCLVYTPVNYDQSVGINYPVLYLLNDFGEDESAWLNQGKINNIIDNAINEGSIHPLIVVMENTNSLKNSEGKEVSDSVIINELIPYIETNYHTLNTAKMRAIAGCSSGGEMALQLALNHKDIFGNLGIFSFPAEFKTDKINTDKLKSANLNVFFLGAGKNDPSYSEVVNFQKALTDKGIKFNWDFWEGSNNWLVWRKNLNNMLHLIFK